MRVLVVEDYQPLRSALQQGLGEEGYAVDVASEGETALWLAEQNDYDVIILDLMLPKVDGLTILQKVRAANRPASVLLLTAKDTVEDRVVGLDRGADDYLVKPFAFAELVARIKVLGRRRYAVRAPLLRIADLEIDTSSRTVHRAGGLIELSAREYAILEYLALRAGELVTRTDIWEHIYDFHSEAQSNVVDVYIGYLRKKIERRGAPRLIHTRRGQGYVLGLKP